ncbi:RNA polymerase factor sigma-54 [Martelella lutilitoris]|uniref:RNA polymerase sigma-54 factor n=1 Tax=Martelella lutilitoris TaxID=2583532 RepID=A0A5C4JLN3_9HYPH|nr:RNA polymerase factor sigma-54 [Martelella lutilitoris]TNB46101.1 RNA polymerase factor sigma-54 [Martelella lutilitoris]
MALSANLFLRQNQSLVMTPQLMQSIQLLQMPHAELNQFIAQEVEKNPLLEVAGEDGGPEDRPEVAEPQETAGADLASDWYSDDRQADGTARLGDSLDSNFDSAYGEDSPPLRPDAPELMSQWKSMPGTLGGDDHVDLDEFVAGRPCLRDHLTAQIALTFKRPDEQAIARHLVDYLDEAGYFRGETAEIAERAGLTADRLDAVLERLKTLDPPGIFAQSLSDCMRQQLLQTEGLTPAMAALVDNLELVARRDFTRLKKLCGVEEQDLLAMMQTLRRLNPKPAGTFSSQPPESVLPDVIVSARKEGEWQVELNPDTLPRVLVNRSYLTEIKASRGMSEADDAFLNTCLQTANWLTRSLDQRARTILKVASEIVRQQDAFLKHGVDHLRPLNLKTVADAIKMHESTVSRVTSNKFILTPRGLYELRYFFSVSIASDQADGSALSAESIRHKIRRMISAETAEAVLSDDDIVSALKDEGITLARRTVAKYREAMSIPSSVQRRREKRAYAKAVGA